MPARSNSRTEAPACGLTAARRALMLAINYAPLAHVASLIAAGAAPWSHWAWRLSAVLGLLYLLPPLLARILLWARPIQESRSPIGSASFFTWWALLSLQVVFCRLPMLEELLRLVPGAYSCWLRLWGSKIGRLTYWAPGTRVLDRSFLDIGDDVVFGAGVRLNPHVLARNAAGEMELILAPVTIGDRAVIGGYGLLTAGTRIAAGECTRACLQLPPFTTWQDGRRVGEPGAPRASDGSGRDQP